MRAARVHWTEATEIFGTAETSPEDELMLMKDIFLADIEAKDGERISKKMQLKLFKKTFH